MHRRYPWLTLLRGVAVLALLLASGPPAARGQHITVDVGRHGAANTSVTTPATPETSGSSTSSSTTAPATQGTTPPSPGTTRPTAGTSASGPTAASSPTTPTAPQAVLELAPPTNLRALTLESPR